MTQLALLESPSKAHTETPRIYVACLAAYNAGSLHGEWIDADQDVDDIQEAIQQMLASSPEPDAEEWAIHDYEYFGAFRVSEYASLETLVQVAQLIQEHGEIVTHVIDHFGGDIDAASNAMTEDYQGCYTDLEDFAQQFTEETGQLSQVPQHLQDYIDFEAMGRDFDLNGDIFTVELGYGECHVFWNR